LDFLDDKILVLAHLEVEGFAVTFKRHIDHLVVFSSVTPEALG
jgi:hypothetical protein